MSLEVLLRQPLPAQIEETLASFSPSKPAHQLQLVTALLKYTVPEAFLHVPRETQDAIAAAFRSAVGLGNLVAKIAMLSSLKADLSQDLVAALNCHLALLEKVLAPRILLQMARLPLELREADKLLFRGKCYSVVREADLRFHGLVVPRALSSMSAYTGFLCRELFSLYGEADIRAINSLVLSLFSLSAELALFFYEYVFHREYIAHLQSSLENMKRYERKLLLAKFFEFVSVRFLRSSAPQLDTIAALYVLARTYLDTSVWDEFMANHIVSRYNYALNLLFALSASGDFDVSAFELLLLRLLAAWGNPALVTEEPVIRQEYRTHMLLCMCMQLPQSSIKRMIGDSAFLSAISTRLSSHSDRVKALGVFFADSVCVMAGEQKIFSMDNINIELDIPTTRLKASEIHITPDDAWDIIEAPEVVESPTEDMKEMERAFQPISLRDEDAMSEEVEEDDPTMQSKPVSAPIYVRDILAYLSADTKDAQAYEKQKLALQAAPTILRQKLAFGTEVAFYAEEIMSLLAGLTNQYDEANFETSKLNAMIAVVVSYPKVTAHVCHLLLTGDYSLQQRMCLLSCISLSARELRGFDDESVRQSFQKTDFPSKKLPPQLHNQYMASENTDYGYNSIENSIQNQLMQEASEEARDELSGGKILRISLALKKKSMESAKEVSLSKEAMANFRKTVGHTFFFPLVAVWYESGGIDIGPYTPILIAHFIRTLSLILHAAYPAAVDLNDMISEYVRLICPVIQMVTPDQLQVIESAVTGFLLVLDICDTEFLVQNFGQQITDVESAVASWWELLIEDKVKSLCAGLLLRIGEMKKSMETVLLDRASQGFF